MVADSQATAVYASRRGPLYYATRKGLYVVQKDSVRPIYEEPDSSSHWHVRPYSFYESRNGDLWFGGFAGACVLRSGRLLRFGAESGVPERGVWCFREDTENEND